MSDHITTPISKLFTDLGTITACCQRDIRRMTYLLDAESTLHNFNIAKGLLCVLAKHPGPDLPAGGTHVQGASAAEVLHALNLLDRLKEVRKEAEMVTARLVIGVMCYAAENGLEVGEGILAYAAAQ